MSTYLFSIVVFDHYGHVERTSDSGVDVKVWAPLEELEQVRYALHVAVESLNFFEKYFNVSYPLPKLDVFAVPKYLTSGMEYWGLILMHPSVLLTKEEPDKLVAKVLAHEIAHQWFGNLVTPVWWDDLWLNEAFARYIEFVAANAIDPALRFGEYA